MGWSGSRVCLQEGLVASAHEGVATILCTPVHAGDVPGVLHNPWRLGTSIAGDLADLKDGLSTLLAHEAVESECADLLGFSRRGSLSL